MDNSGRGGDDSKGSNLGRSNQGQTLLVKAGQGEQSKLVFGLSSLFRTKQYEKKFQDQPIQRLLTNTRLFEELQSSF